MKLTMRQLIIFKNNNVELPEPYVATWDGLTFTALADNSTIYFSKSDTGNRHVYYSYDAIVWEEMPNTPATALTLNEGEFIYCRAAFTASKNYSSTPQFYLPAGQWKVSGKINSLFYNSTYTQRGTNIPTCGCSRMFYNCNNLYDASELDFCNMTGAGTTLTRMFCICRNITSVTCNVTSLGENSVQYMFTDCSSLSYISFPNLANTGTLDSTYYFSKNVAANGTFVKHPNANWSTGSSGIPTGWTVIDSIN